MTESTRPRTRAAITALAPLVLLAAFVWHPYITGRLPNDSAIADAVVDGPITSTEASSQPHVERRIPDG